MTHLTKWQSWQAVVKSKITSLRKVLRQTVVLELVKCSSLRYFRSHFAISTNVFHFSQFLLFPNFCYLSFIERIKALSSNNKYLALQCILHFLLFPSRFSLTNNELYKQWLIRRKGQPRKAKKNFFLVQLFYICSTFCSC